MAVAVRTPNGIATTAHSGTAATGVASTFTVAAPSALAVGDFLLVVGASDTDQGQATFNPASGTLWTNISGWSTTSSWGVWIKMWYRWATAADVGASYTWNYNGGSSQVVYTLALTGVDPANPVAAIGTFAGNAVGVATDTVATVPGITPDANLTQAFLLWGSKGSGGNTFAETIIGNEAELADTTTGYTSLAIASATLSDGAGVASPAFPATLSTAHKWTALGFSLRPAHYVSELLASGPRALRMGGPREAITSSVAVADPATTGRGLRAGGIPRTVTSSGTAASGFAVAPFAQGPFAGSGAAAGTAFGHGLFGATSFGGVDPGAIHLPDPFIGAMRAGHPNAGPGDRPSGPAIVIGFGNDPFGESPFGSTGADVTFGFGHSLFGHVPIGGDRGGEQTVIDVELAPGVAQIRLAGPLSERVRFGTPTVPAALPTLDTVRQALLTPSFTLYAANTRTGRIGFELPFSTLAWDTPLNAVGTLTSTLVAEDVWDALADQDERNPRQVFRDFLTGPWRWSFVLTYGDLAVWAGPYIAPKLDADHPSVVQVGGSELLAVYGRRALIAPGAVSPTDPSADTVFASTTLPAIALALFEQGIAGPGRELPINFPTVGSVGDNTRTYFGYDVAMYQDRIIELTKVENGPDVRLDPRVYAGEDANYVVWDLAVGEPHIGQRSSPWAWDNGVNGTRLGYDLDAKDVSTTFYVPGSGQDRDKVIGTAASSFLINAGFPALDGVDGGHTSATEITTLNGWARADLTQHGIPQESWSVKVPAGGDPRIGQFRVGDDMLVGIPSHPLIPDGDYRRRITKIAGDATPFVTLTGDAPVGQTTTTASPITISSEGREVDTDDHAGMIQAEDGSWVFESYYHQGQVQLVDGTWVPAAYFKESQRSGEGSWNPTGTGTAVPPPSNNDPSRNRFYIDISHFQTGIPLDTVKAYGIEGLVAKIGQGASTGSGFGATTDAMWPTFRDQGRVLWPQTLAGYWYLGDTESPESQAARCAGYIGDQSIPVMLDWEAGGGSWANLLNVLAAFQAAGLKVTMLYVGKGYADANGASNIDGTGLGLVRPRYFISTPGTPDALAAQIPADTWVSYDGGTVDAVQFSQNCTVIPGWNIDCDLFVGTAAEMRSFFQTGHR